LTQLDTSVLKREHDRVNDPPVTVIAFPVTNAVVDDVFQYPVISNIDNYTPSKFVEEKSIVIPAIPSPVVSSAPAARAVTAEIKDNSDTNLYKVESNAHVFNCVREESSIGAEQRNNVDVGSKPSENDDLLELERRLAELAKPGTESSNSKEYSL